MEPRHAVSRAPSPRVLLPLVVAFLLLGAGCGRGGEPDPTPEQTPAQVSDTTPAPELVTPVVQPPDSGDTLIVATPEAAEVVVGQVVRVVGTARNAKLSAVLVADDLLVYCLDHPDGWSSELLAQRLAVTGKLEFTEEFAATTGPDGAVSTGTDGGVFVFRSCDPLVLTP